MTAETGQRRQDNWDGIVGTGQSEQDNRSRDRTASKGQLDRIATAEQPGQDREAGTEHDRKDSTAEIGQ